jgi:hypothetical protein
MVLLPADGAARIEGWGALWGFIDIRRDSAEDLLVVSGISQKETVRFPTRSTWQNDHFLRYADQQFRVGAWYEVDTTLHEVHRQASAPTSYDKPYGMAGASRRWAQRCPS